MTHSFPSRRSSDLQFTELLQVPGVLQSTAGDPAALHAQALELLDEVLDDFIAAREREGGKLVAAILERVDGIAAQAAQVRELIPAIRAGQRAKLDEIGRASGRESGCPEVVISGVAVSLKNNNQKRHNVINKNIRTQH